MLKSNSTKELVITLMRRLSTIVDMIIAGITVAAFAASMSTISEILAVLVFFGFCGIVVDALAKFLEKSNDRR